MDFNLAPESTIQVGPLRTPDHVNLALHSVGEYQNPTVLLVPGTFSNHTFWLGTKGVGFARLLANSGFYACVLDTRGHGQSDRPTSHQRWDIDDIARFDIPTALRAVATPERPAIVIGHSAGGAVILAALSAEPELRDLVSKLVLIATPLPWLQPWRRSTASLIRWLSIALGRFPARLFRVGPEDELPHVMAQWMSWNLKGHWIGDDGTDYTDGLKHIQHPCLVIAAEKDHLFCPPQAAKGLFNLIGSEHKEFSVFEGLDHVSIIASKAAQARVWPEILNFVKFQG